MNDEWLPIDTKPTQEDDLSFLVLTRFPDDDLHKFVIVQVTNFEGNISGLFTGDD